MCAWGGGRWAWCGREGVEAWVRHTEFTHSAAESRRLITHVGPPLSLSLL
jgi:hypothetical protein